MEFTNITQLNLALLNSANVTVDWGDNTSPETFTNAGEVYPEHEYASAGTYNVMIYGESLQNFDVYDSFSARQKLTRILNGFDEVIGPTLQSDLSYKFYASFGYNALTSIPSNLFSNCPQITNFEAVFQGCPLTSIPSGLFTNNINALSMEKAFSNTQITEIPSGIFDTNTLVTNFNYTFDGCTSITSAIPSTIFDNNINVNYFVFTFSGCSNITGNAPELWNRIPASTNYGCFAGCTSLFNYAAAVSNGWT